MPRPTIDDMKDPQRAATIVSRLQQEVESLRADVGRKVSTTGATTHITNVTQETGLTPEVIAYIQAHIPSTGGGGGTGGGGTGGGGTGGTTAHPRTLIPIVTTLPDASTALDGEMVFYSGALYRFAIGNPGAWSPILGSVHASTHYVGGTDPLTGDLDANARVGVRINTGGTTYKRRRINFIKGRTVSMSMADDAAAEEVDLTFTAVGDGYWSCYAYDNANVPNAAWTAMALANESWDTDAFHSNVVNNTRITVPTGGGGLYIIVAQVYFNAVGGAPGTYRGIQIQKNGVTGLAAHYIDVTTDLGYMLSTSAIYTMADGDYVEMLLKQDSGAALGTLAYNLSVARIL